MPKYYCEYCDIYLTHSSPGGRRQHASGRKHISMKIEYYQNLIREKGFVPPILAGSHLPLLQLNLAGMLGGANLNAAAAAMLFRPPLLVNPPTIINPTLVSGFPPAIGINSFPPQLAHNLAFARPPPLPMPLTTVTNINTQTNNSHFGGGIVNNTNNATGVPSGGVVGEGSTDLNNMDANMQNKALPGGTPVPPPANF